MFLRSTTRKKNGKEHRYYSLVENRRLAGGQVVQRHALYLGEINDSQHEPWRKTIEIFEEGQPRPRTVALFPDDRYRTLADPDIVLADPMAAMAAPPSLQQPRPMGKAAAPPSPSGIVVATADSAILDRCPAWFNLARETVIQHVQGAWVVELSG